MTFTPSQGVVFVQVPVAGHLSPLERPGTIAGLLTEVLLQGQPRS